MGTRGCHPPRAPTPLSPPHPSFAGTGAHLLALMRLGYATLRDDFDRVGIAGLCVSGLVAAGEAPL